MRKKIAFYYPRILTGGAEISLINLISRLKRKYDIIVAYSSKNNDEDMLNRMCKHAEVVKLTNKKLNVDTCIYCSVFKYPAKSQKIFANQYIQLVNNNLADYGYTSFELVEEIDKIVCVSETSKKQFDKLVNSDSLVINCDIDEDIFYKANEYKVEYENYLVCCSRIDQYKGFERLLDFAKAVDKKIIIIGDGNGSKYERQIIKKFEELDNVYFLGKMTNPFPYIKNADYLLQFSDMESWGLAVNEALVLGTPCVVTNYESANEQIVEGVNGYILNKDLDNINEILLKITNKLKFKTKNMENFREWDKIL